MFIGFAGVALVAARDYSLGSAVRMGPGYFPLLLGLVLAGIGGILVVRSVAIDGAPVDRLQVRPLASIVIGVVLFGALLERLAPRGRAGRSGGRVGAGEPRIRPSKSPHWPLRSPPSRRVRLRAAAPLAAVAGA